MIWNVSTTKETIHRAKIDRKSAFNQSSVGRTFVKNTRAASYYWLMYWPLFFQLIHSLFSHPNCREAQHTLTWPKAMLSKSTIKNIKTVCVNIITNNVFCLINCWETNKSNINSVSKRGVSGTIADKFPSCWGYGKKLHIGYFMNAYPRVLSCWPRWRKHRKDRT